MDSKASEILDIYQSKLSNKHSSDASDDNDSDLDSLLELLDNDADTTFAESAYREQRIQQLAKEMKESKVRHSDAATVETIQNEAKLFDLMEKMDTSDIDEKDLAALSLESIIPQSHNNSFAGSNKNDSVQRTRTEKKYRSLIVHFFHPGFKSCQLLDTALAELSSKHFNTTKFVRINAVTDCPFLVVKFGLRVLPAVLAFKDGKLAARFNGLDSLVEPATLMRLVKMREEAEKNGAGQAGISGSNPIDTLQRLDTQWIEKVFVERGVLFRNTSSQSSNKKVSWNDNSDSEEEEDERKRRLGYKSITTGKASSWKSTKNHGNDESDDDDGLDI